MIYSNHALVRKRQRSIPQESIDLILYYGTPKQKPGNVTEYQIIKKDKNRIISELKHTLNLIEKATNKAVLVNGDVVITAYNLKE